jgi:uncharacterized protein
MKQGTILRRIYEKVCDDAAGSSIQDVRIGIGYVGVKLQGDRLGVAALLLGDLSHQCSHLAVAGTLVNAPALNLIKYLVEGANPLQKALGVAAANALLGPDIKEKNDEDSIVLMKLTPQDRVAMVGMFSPLVSRIEATGATLNIIERDPARKAVLDDNARKGILKSCTVAVITATSLLNGTMEETLQSLGKPRHVAVLGPTTPLCMEAFEGTPVTHLGGAVAPSVNANKILQIISEGGGTPQMRPWLRFVNLLKETDS